MCYLIYNLKARYPHSVINAFYDEQGFIFDAYIAECKSFFAFEKIENVIETHTGSKMPPIENTREKI